ncbi:MAG: MFS transporter [Gammaproteobacteria bacterium]|nr:MFS transporter [Gammaproteobacteria bacterium]
MSAPQQYTQEQQDRAYSFYRARVFLGIFLGYAGYYLVRKNISLIIPELERTYGYSKYEQGLILGAISLCYGVSKFVMGWVSDRSNAKIFLTIGLVGSALISCFYGLYPAALGSLYPVLFFMGLNGWLQGMGWPPCGRVMVHWFTPKERGSKMALWNIAHNLGQAVPAILISLGLCQVWGWSGVLLWPGVLALIIAYLSFKLVEDTPASVGLPSIEAYESHNSGAVPVVGKETKRIKANKKDFKEHILYNKQLWFLALANLFVYLTRYAIIDWLPSYLTQVRNFSLSSASVSYSLYELAGVAGTLLCGWMSDHLFQGRRAPAAIVFMLAVAMVLHVYWWLPSDYILSINLCLILLGFLIYGPVMLIGLHALDLVPKSVAGTAAGFTGLFGYVGGATCANTLFGWIVDLYGWNGGFYLLIFSCFCSICCLLLVREQRVVVEKKNPFLKKNIPLFISFGVR